MLQKNLSGGYTWPVLVNECICRTSNFLKNLRSFQVFLNL